MSSDGPVRLSQVVGSPSFRSSAINAVAVIPLLSSSHDGRDDPTTHSSRSFAGFFESLHRHNQVSNSSYVNSNTNTNTNSNTNRNVNSNVVVVVPNSNLTRPSDWKYNETPLRNFHWSHGCQRLRFFDGRPYHSREAHDRLINHELTRNWIDLCPSRRTAALIGVLNVRDCPDQATLETAIREWRQWSERYSTPPYEVTAHGRDVGRDTVVPRLFVFDSFHEDYVTNQGVDLDRASESLGLKKSSLVAFPPSDSERSQMMDLHVNVVLNDLAVNVFRELELKIRESDAQQGGPSASNTPQDSSKAGRGFFGRNSSKVVDEEAPVGSPRNLTIENLASVVSPDSELAASSTSRRSNTNINSSSHSNSNLNNSNSDLNSSSHHSNSNSNSNTMGSSVKAQLLTPLDEIFEYNELSPKDAHIMRKREVARRQKFTADLCLLAGSPLDAYERYTKAADMCKSTSPDPLWYASALEGCAAVHIAMADVGGFNVDEYLDSSFQLPEEIMACAVLSSSEGGSDKKPSKKSMPQVVLALCEDALNVTSRHPQTACFHAELLLKLAWYTAEIEDAHIRCQWGLGDTIGGDSEEECCYGGDPNSDKRRWETASVTRLNFLELKNKDGEDVIALNNLKRLQNCSDFLHRAAGAGGLDAVTRADVSLRCLSISWRGVRPTVKPTARERARNRIQLKRKAAFFAVAAAEAMTDVYGTERANAMWIQASKLLSSTANELKGGNYAWATLRAVALHALVLLGTRDSSEEAAKQLLLLLSEIAPLNREDRKRESPLKVDDDGSQRSYSFAGARSYIRDTAKSVNNRSKEIFGNSNDMSSLLAVQSNWVNDDPLVPNLIPMGDFTSDFALRVLELPSVWSPISFQHCSLAQERLINEICELRKKIPVSTLQTKKTKQEKLPIQITSITIVSPDTALKLERVEVKIKSKSDNQPKDHSMATFFNPYAKQQKKIKPTTIPRGEEQNLTVTFSNKLSIPFDVDSCKLVFDTANSKNIKAPSISFTVPGLTKNYAVRFPFIVLNKLNNDEGIDTDSLEVKGIFITALSRSTFLSIATTKDDENGENDQEDPIIPNATCVYPRRDYSKTSRDDDQTSKSKAIVSPRLEITPPQPNLRFSFASSSTRMDEDAIIPVLMADGEIFTLPKMCISNDTGLGGKGMVEELQISAIGLPGLSEVVLYDMSSPNENHGSTADPKHPISISTTCVGMDAETLNSGSSITSSYVATKLFASANMGAETSGCDVTLRFRYRGKAVSPSLEVWRKYEIEIKILRVKGPRIPSLSFRCDLLWDSGYADLCRAFAFQESSSNSEQLEPYEPPELPDAADRKGIVFNRLGQDPGVHVCSEEFVVMLSVANESASPITISRVDGSPMGFAGSEMNTLTVSKGVSAKFPIVLPRVDRSSESVYQEIINMTKLKWNSHMPGSGLDDAQETGGPMFPANCRVRQGVLELPASCLQQIIQENPIFLSRVCKAPCSITVGVGPTNTAVTGKAIDVSVAVDMSEWVSEAIKKRTKFVLSFCCAKQNSAAEEALDIGLNKENRDYQNDSSSSSSSNKSKGYVWIGQTRKNLRIGETDDADAHKAKIMFLEPGEYFVSACLSMSSNSNNGEAETDEKDEPVKEVWWADKAAKMHVSRRTRK